jgi:hypothetical protein
MLYFVYPYDTWIISDGLNKKKMRIRTRSIIHCPRKDLHINVTNKQYILMYNRRIIGVENIRLPLLYDYPVTYVPV